MRYFLTSALLCLSLSARVCAQSTVANVFGHVKLENPEDAGNLLFGMQEVTSGTMLETSQPDTAGNFEFPLLPFATYNLYVHEQGQAIFLRQVIVASPVSLHIELDSIPTGEDSAALPVFPPPWPQAHTLFTMPSISELPVANTIDEIEAMQQNTPGMMPDEYGGMHLRGEDRAPENIIDGIPITTEETRAMSPLFDATLIESADILRGSMDPAYSSDGIMNITTKSGFAATSFGHAEYDIGTNGNSSEEVDLGGRGGNTVAYYGSYGNFSTDRYLDPLTGPDPNHTNGSGSDYFGKVDILPSTAFSITALGYYTAATFQIPNLSTVTPQDQNESLISTLFGAHLHYDLTETSSLSAFGYTRRQSTEVASNGVNRITDSASKATAMLSNQYFIGAKSQDFESGGELSYSARTNWFGAKNDFTLAAQGEVFPLEQYASFAVTNPLTSDSVLGDPRLFPYDLTKGGQPFVVDTNTTGKRISAYAEDRVMVNDWTISGGIRYDLYNVLDQQSSLSPRLNLAYRVSDGFMLRASYNRMFLEAPLENYLISSASEAEPLSGTSPNTVQAEPSNNFELGADYGFDAHWSIAANGYYKSLDNMLVSYQLGNSGIFFPANIKSGKILGAELALAWRDWNHFYGSLAVSTCTSQAIVPNGSSPFGAGLRLGGLAESYTQAALGQSDFNTEYGEPIAALLLLRYQPNSDFFAVLDGRFDGGLPFGLADSNGAAPNASRARQILEGRGITDATINLLDLSSSTKAIRPHAVVNFSIGYNLSHFGLPVMISGSVVNIFNTTYLTHFDPIAGGSYYGPGRSFLLEAELSP